MQGLCVLYVLYVVTPLLGFIKNYSKYKQINGLIFIRTPLVYFLLHNILLYLNYNNIILLTIIYERWFFFIYKIIYSLLNDTYHKKRIKYAKKYGMKYYS